MAWVEGEGGPKPSLRTRARHPCDHHRRRLLPELCEHAASTPRPAQWSSFSGITPARRHCYCGAVFLASFWLAKASRYPATLPCLVR